MSDTHERMLNRLLSATCPHSSEENLGTEGGRIDTFRLDLHCQVGWIKARYLGHIDGEHKYEVLMLHIGDEL